ncbi:9724_t:CDS:2, partial [Funneliformis geosporum]
MSPKLRKKKKSPTEKPEEISSPFLREPSTVSMEGVESIEIALSTKVREVTSTTPSVEEIKKWKRADVINFLQEKKEELDIDDKHIEFIKDQEVSGSDFLLLSEEKLLNKPYNLAGGPATRIAELAKEISGENQVTLKRKYEESTENLTEIVKSAVREEFSLQKPDVISVSKLSDTIMKKIMDDIGIKTAKQEEVQQMQVVEKWFKNVLSLPRNFHVKDVHKQVNFQRHLRGANTIITGGADISVGPSDTACVWIETKKTLEDFQAMGELFLIDKLHPTNAMT